jgi:predicted negative regulator of RcsB-dependent stress response
MNDEDKASTLDILIKTGLLKTSQAAALDLVRSIEDEDYRVLAFLDLTEALIEEGDIDEAEKVVRSLGPSLQDYYYERASAWLRIADYLIQVGQSSRVRKTLVEAETIAQAIEGKWQRAETLHRIAKLLASVSENNEAQRLWDEAIATARDGERSLPLQDSIDCSSVLCEIATDLATLGYVPQAKEVAKSIKNDTKRIRALARVKYLENQ